MEERLLLDIEQWLTQIAPATAPWKHNDLHLRPNIPADEPRNAHAHLQALLLGTDQDVILVELDGPRQRQVSLQWLNS